MDGFNQKFWITIALLILMIVWLAVTIPKIIESKELPPEDDWEVLDKNICDDDHYDDDHNSIFVLNESSNFCLTIKKRNHNEIKKVKVDENLYNEVSVGQFLSVTFHMNTYAPKKWYNIFYSEFTQNCKYINSIRLSEINKLN
jgi:hypothetical protein